MSLGLAPGQPPSMKCTPSSSSSPAMASLSVHREVQALLLRAVAQGGVEHVELRRLRPELDRHSAFSFGCRDVLVMKKPPA